MSAPSPVTAQPGAASSAARRSGVRKWRTVDIVVAAVLAVACGLVFWLWGQLNNGIGSSVGALLPGFQAILTGPWYLAGVLAGLVIRKPGAAFFGEVVAASVSAMIGTEWGVLTLVSGAVQGLAAELVFAAFRYRVFNVGVAMLAGAAAGAAAAVNDSVLWYAGADAPFLFVYALSSIASGAVLAGLLSWVVMRALAATGALDRFASGRALARAR